MNAERRNGAREPIRLSDHFSYGRLIRFTMPTIIMMIFTSIYGVVDGLFVSNVVGKTEFAALNFVFPFIMVLGGAGFMIGTGSTALVAQQLGQGNKQKANHTFTTMVSFTIFLGVILTVIGIAVIRPVCVLLGATPEMIEGCVVYAHAGGLDDDAVGVVLLHHLLQGGAEVAHQRAADAAGVQLVDLDAAFLQKAAVNADLAELVLDQHHLLAGKGLFDELFDQGSFTGTKEAGENIDFGHDSIASFFE